MTQITFGIPQKRVKKDIEVKYPNKSWIKMNIQPLKNGAYKFEINQNAIDLLEFELSGVEEILLGFQDGKVYCDKNKQSLEGGYRITKTGTFSNSKLYGYVKDFLDLDTTVENYFEVVSDETVENAYVMELIVVESNVEEIPSEPTHEHEETQI